MYTAQDPSESHMSWLMWLRQASSASSQAAGWNAARMAEKKGEGGGDTPRAPSPKLEEMRVTLSRSDVLPVPRPRSASWGSGRPTPHSEGCFGNSACIQIFFQVPENRMVTSRTSVRFPIPISLLGIG